MDWGITGNFEVTITDTGKLIHPKNRGEGFADTAQVSQSIVTHQTEVRESLDNVIGFHMMKCTTDGCNGPCNHDNKSDVNDLYDSDDSS
jgi:hypothetical protein